MTRTTGVDLLVLRGVNYRPGKYISIAPRTLWLNGTVKAIQIDADTGSIYELVLEGVPLGQPQAQIGMTADIGTTAGASDVGRVRVRGVSGFDHSNMSLPIALASPGELPVTLGMFVTVREEYRPWQVDYRLVENKDGDGKITSVDEFHDYDQAFGSPHTGMKPKANITAGHNPDGSIKLIPPAAWEDTPGAGLRTQHFSALDSLAISIGATIVSAFWFINDGTYLTGGTTTMEFDATFPVGFRYVYLLATDSEASQHWMQFPIWCHSAAYPPLTHFDVASDETAWDGGREMTFEFEGNPGEADQTVIPQGCTVCYWEVPKFALGNKPQSYRDHALGWITEDVPLLRKVDSHYTIKIAGAAWWLDHFDSGSQALRDTHATPSKWFELIHLNAFRACWYLLLHYSTVHQIINLFKSDAPANETDRLNVQDGTIWKQLGEVAAHFDYCVIGADSFGNIFIEREYSHRSDAERIGIPYLLELVGSHWTDDGIALSTQQAPNVSQVKAGGSVFVGGVEVIYGSVAPGKTKSAGVNRDELPGQYLPTGSPQTKLNSLSGRHWGYRNNKQPDSSAPLVDNLDVVEPCWQRPIRVKWEESTLHGYELHDDLFMVDKVSITHSNANDEPAKSITWTLRRVTFGNPGQTVPVVYPPGVTPPTEAVCELTPAFSSVVTACSAAFTSSITGGTPTLIYWDFDDGGYSFAANPIHVFGAPGAYVVTLFVVDECDGYAAIAHTVTIVSATLIPYSFWGARGTAGLADGFAAIFNFCGWTYESAIYPVGGSRTVAAATNEFDTDEKWIMFDSGLSKGRPFTDGTWTVVKTAFDLWAAYNVGINHMRDFARNKAVEGYMVVTGDSITGLGTGDLGGFLGITHDDGLTWRITFIFEAQHVTRALQLVYMSSWDTVTYLVYGPTGVSTYQILKSTDDGDTWGVIYTAGFLTVSPGNVVALAVPESKDDGSPNLLGEVVYAIGLMTVGATTGIALSRSDDGGGTWAFVSFLPHAYNNAFLNANLYVHPTTSLILVYAFGNKLVRSDDGGLNWTDINTVGTRTLTYVSGFRENTDLLVAAGYTGTLAWQGGAVLYDGSTATLTDLDLAAFAGLSFIEPEPE